MTSFNLNHLLKGPNSKQSPWGLRLQHVNCGGTLTFIHTWPPQATSAPGTFLLEGTWSQGLDLGPGVGRRVLWVGAWVLYHLPNMPVL